MMKQILIQLTLAALIGCSLAVEFIEFNDHNNDLLPLSLSKPFWAAQDAMKNGFKFDHVSDAIKFLNGCSYLEEALPRASDTDYEGLAGKMKAVMADSEMLDKCAVPASSLVKFILLDAKDMGIQVTRKRMDAMVEMEAEFKKSPKAEAMLGDLYARSKSAMGHNLLIHAGEDTTVFFGEEQPKGFMDLDIKYKTGCAISALKPICKLIRKTNVEDVTALGSDVEDFIEMFNNKDDGKISKHVEASGVSLDKLKETCNEVYGNFHAIKYLEVFENNGFVDESMIAEQSKVEPMFHLYNQMYKLCKLSTGRD